MPRVYRAAVAQRLASASVFLASLSLAAGSQSYAATHHDKKAASFALDASAIAPPAPPTLSFTWDAPFGDFMVLQQAPAQAAVYGFMDASGTGVKVTVSDGATGAPLFTVDAALNVTTQAYGPGWGARPCPKSVCPPYDMEPFNPFGVQLPTWKALLPPTVAGGNFTITAICSGCNGNSTLTLQSVTFGDVWYCSGQSNMWLELRNTFSRNETAGNISAGRYSNIRVMAGSSGEVPYAAWPPAYGGGARASNPWMTAAAAAPPGCVDTQNCPLFSVGASCWYTMQALAELGVTTPLGILDTAIGGQRIEEYMNNATALPDACSELNSQQIPWWNGQLFGQQVLPFVDMTVKGWLWLQGENNMGGTKGNALANIGYSCAMRELVRGWRAAWSATPNTTAPLAPFGVITLASSGSEGGPNMGAMRWAQTASFGVLPAPALPATFLAQAYDLDDEWGPEAGPCWGLSYNPKPQWACCAGQGSAYNATTCAGREALCAPSCAAQAGTAFAMSGIHPRSKRQVGERLGRAAYAAVYGGTAAGTGPTLAGCRVSGSSLAVDFNETLLRGDTLVLQRMPPLTPAGGGSQLWVQTNASLFCMEPLCVTNATTGACEHIDPSNPRSPVAMICPTWAGGDGTTVLPAGAYDSNWVMLNFTANAAQTGIVVDLTPLAGAQPTAVRYAWGVIDCCDHTDETLYVTHGCVAACPIMASSGLPANPFQAKIVAGSCDCVAPQVCDGA